MSTPATPDEFLKLVQKSGLIEEHKLAAFVQAHEHDGLLQSDVKKLAATMVRDGLITYFQGEQFLLGKWRGFTLGKFKLLERIGVGGMGQVFLCEHTFMRKRMAVKVLPPTKAEDPVSLGRFYREARVASGLEHPNVVRTHDIDQDGPLHFLVMEYVDGTSLLDIVKRFGPLSIPRACHYIRQACMGLQYAHSAGMIHRDIKPGNIMVDRHGVAKLLDMGLARFYRDEQDQLTLKFDDKNVLGTADYVAPEQTRDSRNIDVRADIYGMGATFYYVLTGQPPFTEATVAEKLIAHQTKKPRSPRELRTEIPPGVAKIVEKMLAKDPKDRFQVPQEIVDALEIWTKQPIDPPSDNEMPKLSPAAMDPTYSPGSPVIPPPPAVRDASHVRPEEIMPSRSVSSPVIQLPDMPAAAFDEARTVPTPPADHTQTLRHTSHAPIETRPLVSYSEPTPKPGVVRPVTAGMLFAPPAPPTAPAPAPAIAQVPRPPQAQPPRLPGSHPGKSVLPPLRPSSQGAAQPAPPPAPPRRPASSSEATRPPSTAGIELPKLRSFHATNPALSPDLILPTATPGSNPFSGESLRPPSVDSFRVPLSAHGPAVTLAPAAPVVPSRLPASATPSGPPAYQPPTVIPFFEQAAPTTEPNPFIRFMRWLLMLAIASAIGAALGYAIWFNYLRPPI